MPLSRCKVLIVEDQLIVALDIQMAVEDANGEVVGPAATVREALELLSRAKVDAAILDANLPDGDVTPVAEELIARGIPIIINTGVALPFKLRGHSDLPVFKKPTAPTCLIRELAARVPLEPASFVQSRSAALA
jgi:CheY-like chemotaxis protein